MANAPYTKGLDKLLRAQIDWINDDIRVILVDLDDYVANTGTHEFLADLPALARVQEVALTNRTTDGLATADAADPTFVNATGDTAEALVIYKFVDDGTGAANETASPLLLFYDSAPGLPVTPNTGDILVQLSASGVLTLA